MFVWIEQTIRRPGDDHYRHLNVAIPLTQNFQTRSQSSFVVSTRPDVIRSHPHFRRLLRIIVLHVLRIVSLLQTLLHKRAAKKRRKPPHNKLAKQRNSRKERPPFDTHARLRRRRESD